MYGLKRMQSVNEARTALFKKKYKPTENKSLINLLKINCVDAASLPPCQRELRQHLLRTCYIADIWVHAHSKIPSIKLPEECGWKEVDSKFVFHWFDGEQLPDSINDIELNQEITDINGVI